MSLSKLVCRFKNLVSESQTDFAQEDALYCMRNTKDLFTRQRYIENMHEATDLLNLNTIETKKNYMLVFLV